MLAGLKDLARSLAILVEGVLPTQRPFTLSFNQGALGEVLYVGQSSYKRITVK